MHTNEQKYNGNNHSFEYKYDFFNYFYGRANMPHKLYVKTFQTMLIGNAPAFHFRAHRTTNQVLDIAENICNNFEGAEYKRSVITKWDALTLRKFIKRDKNKTIESAFLTLISDLHEVQPNLFSNLQDDDFLQNKLVLTC